MLGCWPVSVLSHRLNRIFEDGRIDDEERAELRGLIYELLGAKPDILVRRATKLPLTKPHPDVIFDSNVFVFTGRFLYGTRRPCQREVMERGGDCGSAVTLKTNYLVIGDLGSEDWMHSIYGRKIEKAIEYQHYGLAIISEEHWTGYLLPARNKWQVSGA